MLCLAVLAHQNVLNANKENYGMPLIYTYEQGFGVAYNDDEQTRMMLMPAISVNEQQRLSGTLTLLTMSSKSTQQPAALRLIEYCVEHLDEQTQYHDDASLKRATPRNRSRETPGRITSRKGNVTNTSCRR